MTASGITDSRSSSNLEFGNRLLSSLCLMTEMTWRNLIVSRAKATPVGKDDVGAERRTFSSALSDIWSSLS